MKITDIAVVPIYGRNFMLGTASIIFDDVFKIRDIRIRPRKQGNGIYVEYPQRKTARGDYYAISYPMTKEFRDEIDKVIIDEYHRVLDERSSKKSGVTDDFEPPLEAPVSG